MSGLRVIQRLRVFAMSAKIQPKQLKIKFESIKITNVQNVTYEQCACGRASPKPPEMPCDPNAVRHKYKLK